MSKVHARSHEITNKPLRVWTTKTLWLPTWKTNCNAEKCASDVKKWRIVVNRISKVRQTTCNWIKKILDGATRVVNVFLISWFFCFFFIMFNKLTCKGRFYIAVWSLSKCYDERLVSLKTFLKSAQNQSLSSEICSGSSHEIRCSLPIVFFQRNWPRKFPRNSREIGRFFHEFAPENPAKFDFFSRDLPEALLSASQYFKKETEK